MGLDWKVKADCVAVDNVVSCPSLERGNPIFSGLDWNQYQWLGGIARNGYHGGMGLWSYSVKEMEALGLGTIKQREVWRPKKISEVTRPEQTILIGDGRDNNKGSRTGSTLGMLHIVMWKNDMFWRGTRHRQGMNVGWVDGHADWNDPYMIPNTWYSPFQ